MINFFRRYCKRFRYVVSLDGSPYLIRYRLLSTPWLCIYLHYILRSDNDRELHDHPFNFVSILLWGGYTEYTPDRWNRGQQVSRYYPMGSVIRHFAADAHRLKLTRPVWTLFLRGPRVREWGFHTDTGWVDQQTFHAVRGDNG